MFDKPRISMKILVDIIKESNLWKEQKFINKRFVKKILFLIIQELGVFRNTETIEVAILLTSNERIRILNVNFRGIDKPTNVLSFPDKDMDWESLQNLDFQEDVVLGDIALAYKVIYEEAESFSISFQNHFTHLLVHAILHLLGYDHEDPEDSDVMQGLEVKILHKLDITIPPIYV